MDYLFLSSVRFLGVVFLTVVASYDITCQFFKNFWTRVQTDVPERLRPSFPPERLITKVSKAHLVGHGEQCQGPYNFNYTRGAGRTDWVSTRRARREAIMVKL